eukprot:COSAG01_NODE_30221_length_620_cov_1.297505_2_plen_111_part_01
MVGVAELPFSAEDGCMLIGRQADVCDLVMQHPSVSRHHAVLLHRGSDGQIFVCDLGSTHGTFLNKKRLAPKHNMELAPGDVLRFGESTRLHRLKLPTSAAAGATNDVAADE